MDPTSVAMVEAIGATRTYKTGSVEVTALSKVDVRIEAGEFVAVMGPSGSGKTTLLNCLSGLDELTSGEVLVEGEPLSKMSDRERTRYRARRMGFIFQAFNLIPVFSAVENVELPLLLGGRRPKVARQRALDALAEVGLSERANHRPSELSAGEQQRVAISRAIAPDPAVLWADEPTGNLDSENADKILVLLESLNRSVGLTIIMVTHDPGLGARAARLVRMRDGRLLDREG
ncbi:MAG TPA: ABC transporter ATP-binding protein [Actinomycetota bacterium]|nr:ABC transporter ATP-binding protein [Actinomycetota bacterium]